MGTVAEDNIHILISKLWDSLDGSDLSGICNILDKIKRKEPDGEIKSELQKIAMNKGVGDTVIEMIKDHDGHTLLLAMQVIRKLLTLA